MSICQCSLRKSFNSRLFLIFCKMKYVLTTCCIDLTDFFLLSKGFIIFICQFHKFTKIRFFTFSGVAGSAQKPPSKFILNMSGESESCSSAMSSLESVRSSEVKIYQIKCHSLFFFRLSSSLNTVYFFFWMVIMVKYKTVSFKKDQIAALYFTTEFWKLRNSAELELRNWKEVRRKTEFTFG